MRLNLSRKFPPKTKSPQKKDELWSYVKGCNESGLEARRAFERRWVISLAFLVGKQYTFFNTDTHTLQQLERLGKKARQVAGEPGHAGEKEGLCTACVPR